MASYWLWMLLSMVALVVFALIHGGLAILWEVRRDGQAGMCCCPLGCALLLLSPYLMVTITRLQPVGPLETFLRMAAMVAGYALIAHVAILTFRAYLEEHSGRR